MKELKASNPVEVTDYVIATSLQNEPAFKWWVPCVVRKRDNIVSKLTSRVIKRTHKYGARIPRSIKEAYELADSLRTKLELSFSPDASQQLSYLEDSVREYAPRQ